MPQNPKESFDTSMRMGLAFVWKCVIIFCVKRREMDTKKITKQNRRAARLDFVNHIKGQAESGKTRRGEACLFSFWGAFAPNRLKRFAGLALRRRPSRGGVQTFKCLKFEEEKGSRDGTAPLCSRRCCVTYEKEKSYHQQKTASSGVF